MLKIVDTHRGRLWQARQQVSVAVGTAFALLEHVIEHGEELKPLLISCNVGPYFINVSQYLVTGEHAEVCCPKVSPKAFEALAVHLQIKRDPLPLRVKPCTADIRGWFHRAVGLHLFQGRAKPGNTSVAVYVERT